MKREIKFRGKDILTDKWVYGDLLHLGEYCVIVTSTKDTELERDVLDRIIFNVEDIAAVVPESVGQFTGLLDKNGNDIYEGDVIGCHNPNIKHLIFYNEKQGRFMAALNGDIENDFVGVCGLDDSRWTGSKKVIGNVYDNPELMEGGAE